MATGLFPINEWTGDSNYTSNRWSHSTPLGGSMYLYISVQDRYTFIGLLHRNSILWDSFYIEELIQLNWNYERDLNIYHCSSTLLVILDLTPMKFYISSLVCNLHWSCPTKDSSILGVVRIFNRLITYWDTCSREFSIITSPSIPCYANGVSNEVQYD